MKKSLAETRIAQSTLRTALRVSHLIAIVVFVGSAGSGLTNDNSESLQGFLKSYVDTEDASYEWSIKQNIKTEEYRYVLVDLTSQSWLTLEEVNRTDWQHWIEIYIPNNRESDVPMLFIAGGGNSGEEPSLTDSIGLQIALVSKTVVAQLGQVPNQPLVFLDDGKYRSEDDLISFSWTQFLKTNRLEWLAQAPMVKSASRAMDAVSEVLATEEIGAIEVDKFVVAGGSKRGWTTWLTAVVDTRVIAIAPIVFDVLNMRKSLNHHFGAYGFWSVSLGDYVNRGILHQLQSDELDPILQVVDPFHYLSELDIPKFIVNATGDEFFLLDSSQFYWNELVGPKYLRYVPNAEHGLSGSDALQSLAAFVSLATRNQPIPSLEWSRTGTNRMEVRTSHNPLEATVWVAHNPISRDFRLLRASDGTPRGPVFSGRPLTPNSDSPLSFEATMDTPESGWTAWFAEFGFDVGLDVPLKLSTDVQVSPTKLPFADKDFTQDTFVSIHCQRNHDDEQIPEIVLGFIEETVGSPSGVHKYLSDRDYYTWKQTGDLLVEGTAVSSLLNSLGYEECLYQLESGDGPTLPPYLDDEKKEP